ncbi:hypothetical protein M501DRAFT_1030375 [Patellaria atrata CBS 101060]|uniref:Uncharacterized protein n=1 Tax=Patellaria atrata CBS 101060 TaxID=1346257 RepID=A0A9P4VNT1_9PEZI|nr:hypothetical protein M501DRAFT_1030375 [Patellaria atrata CBS 101060]
MTSPNRPSKGYFKISLKKNLQIRYVLRALGLDFLSLSILRPFTGLHSSEQRKTVIQKSFWVALSRSTVHIIPLTVSVAIIAINMTGYFIGAELAGPQDSTPINMALLQVAAKAQELLMVASVGTVLFHRIRHDLLNNGLPFGLYGSGLTFTQASFFWSPEFLAGISSISNWSISLLIVFCGFIAATAGPATAILIIPRQIVYPAGSTEFYINGSREELWPRHVEMSHYMPNYTNDFGESIDCQSSKGYLSAVCPTGGFLPLMDHFASAAIGNSSSRQGTLYSQLELEELIDDRQKFRRVTDGQSGFALGDGILVRSKNNHMAPQTITGAIGHWASSRETYMAATHGPTINLPRRLRSDWYLAAINAPLFHKRSSPLSRFQYFSTQITTIRSSVPVVRVTCRSATVDINSTSLLFPAMPEFHPSYNLHGAYVGLQNISIDALASYGPSNQTRATVLDPSSVETEDWGTVTAGIVVEFPWKSTTTRVLSACSVDARWAAADVWTDFVAFQSDILRSPAAPTWPDVLNPLFRTTFLPINGSWHPITVSPAWLTTLTTIPSAHHTASAPNGSVLETLLATAGFKYADTYVEVGDAYALRYLEHVLATLFADALSRTGAFRTWDTTPTTENSGRTDTWRPLFYTNRPNPYEPVDLRAWSPTLPPADNARYTTLHMRQAVTGFGYGVRSTSDSLALVVLASYIVLACAHTFYVLAWTRKTGGCWDTFAELAALALGSAPPRWALRDTCAGIAVLGTLRRRVRVQVAGEGRVELVFEEEGGRKGRVGTGVRYGGG